MKYRLSTDNCGAINRRAPFRFAISGAAGALLGVLIPVHAETWDGPATGGVWNVATNWSPDTVPDAVSATAIFDDPTANRTVTYGEAITVGSIIFNNSTGFFNRIGSNTVLDVLTFDAAGGGPATITVTGNATGSTTPNGINGPVVLQDNLIITVPVVANTSAAGAFTFIGSNSTITGPGGVTKDGPGTMTFADTAKAFTGPLVIEEGRLRFNANARASATSSVTVASGGQIALDGSATYIFGSADTTQISLNGTGLAAFPGAIRVETDRVVTIPNRVVLQSSSALNVVGTSGSMTLTNIVSGLGALTFSEPAFNAALGKLVLSAANTYSGGTVVKGGTLVVGGSVNATLGSGDVTVASASSVFGGAVAKLTIQTGVLDAIANNATLSLAGGGAAAGVADDGFAELEAGVNEKISGLVLGGVAQALGTYGSSASAATNKFDEYFSGAGIVTVVPEPGAAAMLLGGLAALFTVRRRCRA